MEVVALSPISQSSFNCISPSGTNLTHALSKVKDLGKHGYEHEREVSSSSPFGSNSTTESGLKKRKSLSPFKGLSPRKASRSDSKQFDIFDEHDDGYSKMEPCLGRRPSSSNLSSQNLCSTDLASEAASKVPSCSVAKRNEYDEESSEIYAQSVNSDDTCFSRFSAIPNADMTLFASAMGDQKLHGSRSPVRTGDTSETPRGTTFTTPSTSRKLVGSANSRAAPPTPRRTNKLSGESDTTNLLLDFTQQFDSYAPSCTGAKQSFNSPSKVHTEPDLLAYMNQKRAPSPNKSATPARNIAARQSLLNLLDFDLPPQPTPRSIPSITVRELESLKSSYLSEISHLRACLSGREAEVESLKKAVGDAERRVGEAQETLEEERSSRQYAESEKAEWEKKGREVEMVLKTVKGEFLLREKENEELLQKLEESRRLREEAELRATEASSKATVSNNAIAQNNKSELGQSATEDAIAQRVAQELDEKMENLARELHAVYKKKHESKVATLKKTYEARADKKCNELQKKVEELSRQNELVAKPTPVSGTQDENAKDKDAQVRLTKDQNVELQSKIAVIAGLKEEIRATREMHSQLHRDLEKERVEKGELVAAVDEMLALQDQIGAPGAIEDFKKSINRPSSLRPPGVGESKIARIGTNGIAKTSMIGKSRMMSNIERMGSRVADQST